MSQVTSWSTYLSYHWRFCKFIVSRAEWFESWSAGWTNRLQAVRVGKWGREWLRRTGARDVVDGTAQVRRGSISLVYADVESIACHQLIQSQSQQSRRPTWTAALLTETSPDTWHPHAVNLHCSCLPTNTHQVSWFLLSADNFLTGHRSAVDLNYL